jgi:hypothetical protein
MSELSAAAMQAPKLQGSGLCGKLVITLVCCVLLFGVLFVVNFVLSQPAVVKARTAVHERLASSAPQTNGNGARKPMPAILHRFGALKRSPGSTRSGADLTLRTAFPRWRAADGSLKIEETVTDLALGIAALIEQLDPSQELKLVTRVPPPPAPSLPPVVEPDAPNGDSEQELEL